jgi:tyrosyl-tRNA synthetase
MGKTAGNAVWRDPNKTSPFDFYQYWRNVADADVLKCIRMLTFLPIEQIEAMSDWEGAQLNEAKDILAYELTNLVHGEEEANKAREASKALFSGAGNLDNMPTAEISSADLINGTITIVNILSKAGLVPSNSEGRRAVEQGGVTVNGEKVTDAKKTYTPEEINSSDFIVRRGKKSYAKIVIK